MRNIDFALMSLMFRVRDLIRPPLGALKEAGVQPGMRVLDYGCGPGNFSLAAAAMVGDGGMVYALDELPVAIERVERKAQAAGLANIKTILSDCRTGLDDASIDVALLYDAFHDLADPDCVLNELYRVLKPGAVLSFSDHHMKDEEIVAAVTAGGMFRLAARGKRTFTFKRE